MPRPEDYAGDIATPWPNHVLGYTRQPNPPRRAVAQPHPALGARVVIANPTLRQKILAWDEQASFYGHVFAITTETAPHHFVQIGVLTHADRRIPRRVTDCFLPYTFTVLVNLNSLRELRGAGFTPPIWAVL